MKNSYLLLIVLLLLAVSGFSQSKKSQIISTTDTLWRFLNNQNSLGTSTFGFITGSDTTFIQSDGTILNFISSELLHNGLPIGGSDSYWDRDENGFLHPLTLSDYIKLDTTAIQGLDTAIYSHDAVPLWQIIDSINAASGGGGSEWTRSGNMLEPINSTDTVTIGSISKVEKLNIAGHINMKDGTSTNLHIGDLVAPNRTTASKNIFIGEQVAKYLTYGSYNLAIGYHSFGYSSYADITGGYNVALGYETLNKVTSGQKNMAIGGQSMNKLTTGYENTGIGQATLYSLTTGRYNVAIGGSALLGCTDGEYNVGIGWQSQKSATGDANVSIGYTTCQYVTGNKNTIIGGRTGYSIRAAHNNVAIGYESMFKNITGGNNTFIGYWSGYDNTGSDNIGIGFFALHNGTSGTGNIFMGRQTGNNSVIVNYNVVIGHNAGYASNSGDYNVFLGYKAGYYSYDGDRNIAIGNNVGVGTNASDSLNIGNIIHGNMASNIVTINDALVLNPVSASPSNPSLGMLYCDSDDNHLYFYNGSAWVQID